MATDSIEINLPEFVGKVFSYPEIDSTQAESKRKIAENFPLPFLIIAESQTAGIGRFRRKWYSPPGGLYFTLSIELVENPTISLVVGIALIEILKSIAPLKRFVLKWPNDVLTEGKKIAGILVENFDKASLIGLGINTFKNGEFYSIPLDKNGRNRILSLFLKKFETYLDELDKRGFEYFLPKYIGYTISLGTEITIFASNKNITGFFSGITDDGSLILQTDGGKLKFTSGEVSLRIDENP